MRRGALAGIVAAEIGPDDVVICSLGSVAAAWRQAGSPTPTYFASDPMGMAPALALGFALARPEVPVTLLEGDGDLAMNLGALVAITDAPPPNLRVVVFANGRYETGGSRDLAGRGRLDLAAVARGCGWDRVFSPPAEATDAEVEAAVRRLYQLNGPAMVVQPIEPEASLYGGPGAFAKAEEKVLFQRALAAREQPDGAT